MKSDWWWKVESGSPKIIGPRAELLDEIVRESSVDRFHLYNTEGFLKYANKELNAQVADQAIEEVRSVAHLSRHFSYDPGFFRRFSESVEQLVYDWFATSFDSIEKKSDGFSRHRRV